MIAVVSGLIGLFPVGGVFWDYVQYALALERLGFEVYYLEDTTFFSFDPELRDWDYEMRWEPNVTYLENVLSEVSPDLGKRWHFRGLDDRCYGIDRQEMAGIVADADVFLNTSGVCVLRDEYMPCRRKVLIDTDPGWNHFGRFPKADRERLSSDHGYRAHDHFFTYATRIGASDCLIPDMGLDWHPTRPPVVLDAWAGADAPGLPWTTVLTWDNAVMPLAHEGVEYGTKEREFPHIEDLPQHVSAPLEIAVGGNEPPVERWRANGWSIIDSIEISRSPESYRDYIHSSRGELSIAKHVYVATRCGWFSCRSICYMASGRPVVLQDTGFSDTIPTGEGVLAFVDREGAAAALDRVEASYETHATAARQVAEEHFAAEKVVSEMLNRMEV